MALHVLTLHLHPKNMFQVKGWFGLGFDFKWDPYKKSTRVAFYSFELHVFNVV